MSQHEITVSALINSPAKLIYKIIADYQNGHPHILPKPYFVSLQVEQGGMGSGTVVSFQMKLMGNLRSCRATIREPEPGRMLVENNEGDDGAVTTFIVDPHGDNQSHVTIKTKTKEHDGFLGKVEGWMTTHLLRPVYIKELQQLAIVNHSLFPSPASLARTMACERSATCNFVRMVET